MSWTEEDHRLERDVDLPMLCVLLGRDGGSVVLLDSSYLEAGDICSQARQDRVVLCEISKIPRKNK